MQLFIQLFYSISKKPGVAWSSEHGAQGKKEEARVDERSEEIPTA
jgi:hypothetical protein